MVVEIETEDGTIYQCVTCGEQFDEREGALDHEEYCSVPRSM